MLFNSYIFILCFLPVTWVIYFLLNSNRKYKATQVYLLVIAGSIAANYSIASLAHLLRNRSAMLLNRGGLV